MNGMYITHRVHSFLYYFFVNSEKSIFINGFKNPIKMEEDCRIMATFQVEMKLFDYIELPFSRNTLLSLCLICLQ